MSSRLQVTEQARPFHQWILADESIWSEFYRKKDCYLVRFPGFADFEISLNNETIRVYPAPNISSQTIQHLYLNQVLPLALSRSFKLVLHASAVEIQDFAVAFLGQSGRGKSTLAASFSTSGHRFLTDDGLQLRRDADNYFVKPSQPSIRLWDDSLTALIPETTSIAPPLEYTRKSCLFANDQVTFCSEERPLRCMYFLGEGKLDIINISRLSGREAMIELVKHCFLLDIEEREMLKKNFDQIAALAKIPMFFTLDYPRHYDWLPRVQNSILQHINDPLLDTLLPI